MDNNKIYTVSKINSRIKNMFEDEPAMHNVSVVGEVSNCTYNSSGHIYFTLKDENASISCVMFRSWAATGIHMRRIVSGQSILVRGNISVYETNGKYQLYAEEVFDIGAGPLYEKYEKLKSELEEMGMFSEEYKKPIPRYIKRLGVVTAPTGAAITDIIKTAKKRNPYIEIILYPAIVQGDAAVASIINGIHALENIGVDTMIVGRGGGTIEDLWAFNERDVAQAIFDCSIPIISSVGHQSDTTIADYVADFRAETPTAAAVKAVDEIGLVLDRIDDCREKLRRSMQRHLEMPRYRLENLTLMVKNLSPVSQIRHKRMYCMELEERLGVLMETRLSQNRHRFELDVEKLKGLSPLDKLSQGYAYVEDADNNVVNDIHNVNKGDKLNMYLKNGIIEATVNKATEVEHGS